MKKFISILVAAFMIAAMIPAIVNAEADEEEYVSPGNVIVPYTSGENITIDGTLSDGEWSETNRLVLEAKTNFKSWGGYPEYRGQIDFYYSWGDKGLYMAAIVLDDTLEDGIGVGNLSTRFQIALNPAAIIDEDYQGLFFSIAPEDESDVVHLYRHNWECNPVAGSDGCYDATEEGFEGKYTFIKDGDELIGWNLECMIPWDMIATAEREEDLDADDSIMLTSFSPKDENRKRAFCTATICYVQCNTADGGLETLGRTCTDGDANDFTTASYDIVLLFALPGETDRSTETEYFTGNVAPVTDAGEETTAEATEETTAEAGEETTAEAGEDTTAEAREDTTAEAGEDTTAEAGEDTTGDGEATTAAEGDKAVTETEAAKGGEGSTNKTGLIIAIAIAAVVAVAAVVVAVVLSKKKKA